MVVTYNNARDISALIDSLRVAASNLTIRLFIVDNESSDGTLAFVSEQQDVVLVESGGNIGYSAGINVAIRQLGDCDYFLVLNPDLSVAPDAIPTMIAATKADNVGSVVPLVLDSSGANYPSLSREPSVIRSLFDALLTRDLCARLGLPSESDLYRSSYEVSHDVDGAMGCALLVPADVVREVGEWSEEFFLYSEEVDYFRRIRALGRRVLIEPAAVVKHHAGGSGNSVELKALMASNRVRYVGIHHGPVYTTLYRLTVLLKHLLRSSQSEHRRILAALLGRNQDIANVLSRRALIAAQQSGPTER